jgi:hypothetical protein
VKPPALRRASAGSKPDGAGEGRITSGSEAAISLSKDATSIPTGGYCHIITCGEIGADAACTSAFPTLDCTTVEADQTPNAVAAIIAKPMIPIGLPLRPV